MRTATYRWTAAILALLAVAGCSSSRTSYESDEATSTVGVYSPPPSGAARPRLGVPPFLIEDRNLRQSSSAQTAAVAADQLTTLLVRSQRFLVIERAQLEQLLREQDLEGIVRADEMAAAGQVRGVDFLMIGKITNWRISREKSSGGFGLGRVNLPGRGNIGALDIDRDKAEIKVEIGVDLRIVDPASGAIMASEFSEYNRTDTVSAFGVDILGASAQSDADLRVDEDNKGRLLRLALDKALRKMMPQIDNLVIGFQPDNRQSGRRGAGGGASPPAPAPAREERPAPAPAAGGGDYMPEQVYLVKHQNRWKPAVMTDEPPGNGKPATFVDVRTNDEYRTPHYLRTRPMRSEDIEVGTKVMVINLFDKGHEYTQSGEAGEWWKDRFTHWEHATVVDAQSGDAQLFQAPVNNEMREVHISNARVIVEASP